MQLHSYPSIYNMGHKAVKDLLKTPVYVQEKVDGSQFSFGVINGELFARSKGAPITLEAPDKLFSAGVAAIKELQPLLVDGWTYRGEYLSRPKHNALIYERIPKRHVILFDINIGQEDYLPYEGVVLEAERLGMEAVPLLYTGIVDTLDQFRGFLDRISILGGQKIEGVVVKPVGYGVYGVDKKCLLGKFVSEAFKEVHAGAWKEANPTSKDIIAILAAQYGTQARWMKAVQHLKEAGAIEDSPKDIGILIKEVKEDIKRECEEEIKSALFAHAWEHISRAVCNGLPEWYKEELLKSQFEVKSGS